MDLLIDGSITKTDYDKKLKELKDKQYDINIQLDEHTKADESYYITASTVAPRVGIEPTTNRLTGDCSTAELPGNVFFNKFSTSRLHISLIRQLAGPANILFNKNRENIAK
jgi:hypothetical protein